MGGWEGRAVEERTGLSTAGGRFLFEMSNGVSEMVVNRVW